MSNEGKDFSLLFVVIIAVSSLVMAEFAFGQSMPKPSVPTFAVALVGPSFDIPPTYSFNASTGLFDVNEGYHIEYSAVKIIIENQPFVNQTNVDYLYYNIRIKPHNYPDSYWLELFNAGADGYPIQTLSNSTTIPLPVEGAQVFGTTIPAGAKTDIQVEAMIGHIGRNQTMSPYPYPYVFFGETSGWSNTQTVTLPPKTPLSLSPSSTPYSMPTPTSNVNSQDSITLPLNIFVIIIAVFVLTIMALSILLYRRH